MSILVTGAAGYIGSHTCVELLQSGYEVVAVDNLVNASREALRRVERITGKTVPFYQTDACDPAALEAVFAENPIYMVVLAVIAAVLFLGSMKLSEQFYMKREL